jgi:hypothetical protein
MERLGKNKELHTNNNNTSVNRNGTSQSATLVLLLNHLEQMWQWILASIVMFITGDIWNITLHVHTRAYLIGSSIINGHKVYSYIASSKLLSDFIGTRGYSIGDLLIYSGVALFAILAIVLIVKTIRNK